MAKITSNSITFIDHTGVEKYLYIRYSNDGITFTDDNGKMPGEWLGTCSTNSSTAPTDFSAYTWSKVKGTDGPSLYTWIKYADDAEGTNMSDDPNGKLYIGIAYNKETSEESMTASDYAWSLITNRGIDHIEEYYVTTANPTDTPNFSGAKPNVIPILNSTDKKYLWNKEVTYFTDGDTDETEPAIIGVYGDTGVGIRDIENYYTTTKTPDEKPAFPSTPNEAPKVDSTNKYLWNYEKIIYTDGSSKSTAAAIIGVYGDKGAAGKDAITFQIYSADGFEFVDSVEDSEEITVITLQTASFKGGSQLTNAQYQWFYLDASNNEVNIEEATSSSLAVNIAEHAYALSSLGCKMIYDGNTYRDYVTLRKKIDVYTAEINFFEGTNVFAPSQEYIVVYIELYKNGEFAEGLATKSDGVVNKYAMAYSVSNNVITTTHSSTSGDLMYFVYNKTATEYAIVLGKCNGGTSWEVVSNNTKYKYINSLKPDVNSNVFVVSKSDISRSSNLDVSVYLDALLIASTRVTIIDLNDTIVGENAPEATYDGQLWFNTKEQTLYISTNGKWEKSSQQQPGQSVFTSMPSTYRTGDLWIVSAGDAATLGGKFTEGSMWRANISSSSFNADHWDDANKKLTEMQDNILKYFTFNLDTGLKIGQIDEKFYVNIDSQKMGFYDNSNPDNPHREVVYISNQTANIDNVTVEGSAKFDCDATFNHNINFADKFQFRLEDNGSLSLVIAQ